MASEKVFPIELDEFIKLSDNEINSNLNQAYYITNSPGHDSAKRIMGRQHFKLLYEGNSRDNRQNPEASELIYNAVAGQFGEEYIRRDLYKKENTAPIFPVLLRDGRIESSIQCSELLNNIPVPVVDYIFMEPKCVSEARVWLEQHREQIIEGGSNC